MKQILLLIVLCLCGCVSAQNNVKKTAGINYTQGPPNQVPSEKTASELSVDTITGYIWQWHRTPGPTNLGSWIRMGQGIDVTVGGVPPAYAPFRNQSWFAINGSNELYHYSGTGTVWDLVSGGGGIATVSTDSTLSGDGSLVDPLKIAQRGATAGQVLKWDGATWKPAADAGGATNISFTENAFNDITVNSSTGLGFNIIGVGGTYVYEDTPGVLGIESDIGIGGAIGNQQIAYGAGASIEGNANLTWNGSGVTVTKSAIGGGAQLITNGMVLDNPTNAANLSQQKSPPIVWRGNGWKTTATAASQPVRFIADVLPVQGTSAPSATWRLSSSINGAAFGDRFAVTSGGFAGVGTITPRRTFEVNGNLLFTGNVYDNQDNALMLQSAVGVTSNRDFTFGNTTYGRYLVTFKNFSFSTVGSHPALGNYLFYVNGDTYTSASVPPPIYFRSYQAQAASNTRGGDFIIDLPPGDGTGRRGAVGIGTATVDNSAVVDITSTTAGVLFPRMTTTQRDAIPTAADGLVIFNTTDTKLQVRAGGAWVDLH